MKLAVIGLVVAMSAAGCTSGATPSASVTPSSPSASPAAVVSASPIHPAASLDANGCPTGDAGNVALSTALNRTLRLPGGHSLPLTTASVAARNASWSADDAIPEFATLDLKMQPTTAKAGGTVAVSGSAGMTLTGGTAKAWRLSQVSTSGGIKVTGSAKVISVTIANGKLVLHLPSTADTWVVELLPKWQTTCLKGDGSAYPLVKTH